MNKPVIGITANSLFAEGGAFPGMEKVHVNRPYLSAVEQAGGIPVLLPTVRDKNTVAGQLERVDAVILSGGGDINPLLFGEEPEPKLGFVLADRDEYEIELTRLSRRSGKPLLAICRGLQIVNVAFGGSLYQDIYSQAANCRIKHSQDSRSDFAGHSIDVVPGSLLHAITGKTALTVNSFHHQAVKQVADGFIATALARDGMIEAIEKPGETFLLAVQWHPEMLVDTDPLMLRLFQHLTEEAKKRSRIQPLPL